MNVKEPKRKMSVINPEKNEREKEGFDSFKSSGSTVFFFN